MSDNSATIMKSSLVLGGFSLVVAVVLMFVNLATAERIRAQELAAERRALSEVYPAQYHDNDLLDDIILFDPGNTTHPGLLDGLTLSAPRQGYVARKNGAFAGAIIPVDTPHGYSGNISMLVGILEDGTITGARVLTHRETPGLGDGIDASVSDWIFQFDGKKQERDAPQWNIVRDGGDFDQLTGATVTSRAVVNAVNRAMRFFINNQAILSASNAD